MYTHAHNFFIAFMQVSLLAGISSYALAWYVLVSHVLVFD